MAISPSELRPDVGATHSKKRRGRGPGSGNGTTAGRGNKGQKSRSGKKLPYDAFEGGQFPMSRKFHTLRGFNNKWRVPYQPVNLGSLDRFEDGEIVTPAVLQAAGVLRNLNLPVKILADGEFTKKLNITAGGFSASAKAKIESLGGTAALVAGEID